MSCIQCVTYSLPSCPSSIHLVDSGLDESVDYNVQFTDKFDNKYVTLIEAPFPANDIVIPIENNPEIPEGLFTPFSGMVKMEIFDSAFEDLVPFSVNAVETTCVLISFTQYEGVVPTATINGV
jgi:hypothetical protein